MKPTLFLLLLLFTSTIVSAQYLSCAVTVSTIINNKPVILKSEEGVLTLNSKSGDIELKVKNSSLMNETDTFNALFHLLEDDIVFTGNIQNNIFTFLNQEANTGKNFPLQGTLNINTLALQMVASYSATKINNQRDDLSRNLKMSLFINFPAAAARLNKYYPAGVGDFLIQVNEVTTNIVEE
jgi:hypothetical protein